MTQLIDKDLLSVQEVRDLLRSAAQGQAELAKMSQKQIDSFCHAIMLAALEQAGRLAAVAQEETGYGRAEDKTIKNYFAARTVFDYIKDMRTVGIVNHDEQRRVFEVAVPVGVIAALIPSTNPSSTVIYKALVSIKAGNAIVFSPHPSAKNCIIETVEVVRRAAEAAGLPPGCIGVMKNATKEGTDELLSNNQTSLILATGGEAMVQAAYSSGNPAIGVGPGNGPAYIEKSADIPQAVSHIIDSKTFDNGVICASEQSIIVEREIETAVLEELSKQGCHFLSEDEKLKMDAILLTPNHTMNPSVVGKSVEVLAQMAGISVPRDTKLLIGRETQVGRKIPFSREKLCPVLAFYTVGSWREACALAIRILSNEGVGHTMIMHSNDEDLIREFALEKPVSRLLINTAGALGGIGATTMLPPSLTLGCGAAGGGSTSDNITPLNLINLRRIAYGTRELSEIRASATQDLKQVRSTEGLSSGPRQASTGKGDTPASATEAAKKSDSNEEMIDSLVNLVYKQLKSDAVI